MKLSITLGAALVALTSAAPAVAGGDIYKDSSASIDARVSDLLSKMTIEEKTSQLLQGDISNWVNMTNNNINKTGLQWSMEKRGGSFYVGYPVSQQWIAEGVIIGQKHLVEDTRLGIPSFVQSEGIHGLLIGDATIFNSPIAHACSFNPGLIRKMGAAIAQESLALGVNQILGPVADLARELRFGRVEETFGEDGYLAGEMGYAYIIGKNNDIPILSCL